MLIIVTNFHKKSNVVLRSSCQLTIPAFQDQRQPGTAREFHSASDLAMSTSILETTIPPSRYLESRAMKVEDMMLPLKTLLEVQDMDLMWLLNVSKNNQVIW